MEDYLNEVRYDIWCKRCINHLKDETAEPCRECLCEPCNFGTTRPVKFKPTPEWKKRLAELKEESDGEGREEGN